MTEKKTRKRSSAKSSRLEDFFSSLFSFRKDGKSKVGKAIMPTYEDRLEAIEGDPLEKLAKEGLPTPLLRKIRSDDQAEYLLTLLKGVAANTEQEVDVTDIIQAYLRQILPENTPDEKIDNFLAFFNTCPTHYQAIRSAQRLIAVRCHPELKVQFSPWMYRVAFRVGFNDKMQIFAADILQQIDISASESRSALFNVRKEMASESKEENES